MYVADTKRLTSDGAKKMMATAIAGAREAGIAVSVAIADAGGHLILLERMDGGRFHTVHSSTTKAVAAASNKRPTTAKGAQGQELDVLNAIGLTLAAGPERWTATPRRAPRPSPSPIPASAATPIFPRSRCSGPPASR